jgi:two-component system OmpR family sensor kinase
MSLRARLLLGAGIIAVVLAVAAAAIVNLTRSHLIDQVDAQLGSAYEQLGDLLRDLPGGPARPGGNDPAAVSSLYIGLLTRDGQLVTLREPNLHTDAPLPVIDDRDVELLVDGRTITVGSTVPATDYRMRGRTVQGGRTVVLALPLDDVRESVRQLLAIVVVAGLAVLGVLGLVVWWVIRLGVRPVRRMTETAGAIAAGDLSQRVDEGTPGTEAGDLGVALNGMLGRIEEAFDQRAASEARLRQFVADASHELRTPVATIRGYAELYRTGALEDGEQMDDAMRRTEAEAVRMGSLVDDLLHLARLDQGRPLEREVVDLGRVVEDSVADARAVEPDRTITTAIPAPVTVVGDRARLHQVLANLVSNARVHAPGAAIEVTLREEGAEAVIEVRDDGPGMVQADAARAFERFYRADTSRSRQHGGTGIGLANVDATVRAHGGTTSIDSSPGEGTTVTVRLPQQPTAGVTVPP